MTDNSFRTQAQPEARNAAPKSLIRLFFIVVVSIMTTEIAIMFLFGLLPPMSPMVKNILDGVLLTVLLFPILYLFLLRPMRLRKDVFRPLSGQVLPLGLAETSLRLQNDELKEKSRQLLELQEELVRKEKLALLGLIADTVGHELRNPLGVMNNAVYYLQTVLNDADENTREYLDIIKDEIADAERIVSDLLDAVQTKPPHPEAVNVAQVIGQTLRKCAIPASVTVRLDIPKMLLFVRVDPMHLHQVLWNLLTNAVEAMPEGGTLEIDAVEVPQAVRISVKDSGIGMTPEQQIKLFQPLFTTKARRIGLGLVVVKNLTQANGGSVGVESVAGKGSVFTITLPCDGL